MVEMDIEQFAYGIIEKIKALPPETKHGGPYNGLPTIWEEFKELIQYKENVPIGLYGDLIETMVRKKIYEEDCYDIEILHYFFSKKQYIQASTSNKREDIIASIIYQIYFIAQAEEIDYPKNIEFVMYKDSNFEENGLINIAKVIKRISLTDYIVHIYSHNSVPKGEKGVINLMVLEEKSNLQIVTSEKFDRIMESFNKVRRDILSAWRRKEQSLIK